MPPGLDELELMQAGSLLAPAGTFGNRFDVVGKLLVHEPTLPVPLDVGRPLLQVDRPGLPSKSNLPQAQSFAPVPEL